MVNAKLRQECQCDEKSLFYWHSKAFLAGRQPQAHSHRAETKKPASHTKATRPHPPSTQLPKQCALTLPLIPQHSQPSTERNKETQIAMNGTKTVPTQILLFELYL
jgi:hypothetical protein